MRPTWRVVVATLALLVLVVLAWMWATAPTVDGADGSFIGLA